MNSVFTKKTQPSKLQLQRSPDMTVITFLRLGDLEARPVPIECIARPFEGIQYCNVPMLMTCVAKGTPVFARQAIGWIG